MNKQTLSILLALVLLLSISIFPVFAQETSEEELSGYFGVIEDWNLQDLSLAGVDAEAVDLTEFESKSVEDPVGLVAEPVVVDGADQELQAKAWIKDTVVAEGEFVPCGDGKISVKLTIEEGAAADNAGITYIDSIDIDGLYDLKDCKVGMGDSCDKIYFVGGKATITGYFEFPDWVLDSSSTPSFTVNVKFAVEKGGTIYTRTALLSPTASTETDLCSTVPATVAATKGVYEQCGGKASFKVDLEIPEDFDQDCLIPAQIYVNGVSHTNYTCRYTRFGEEGYPFGGDYCTPGKPIEIKPGDKIRFEAIIDDLANPITDTASGDDLPVNWRFGYNPAFVTGIMESVLGPAELCDAKIVPLKPLDTMTDADEPIEPSGWYGTYDKAVLGLYQKCGKYSALQVRLRNDGAKVGYVNLPGAIAINGGTPISFYWLSDKPVVDNKIALASGDTVTLIARIWMTNVISQTNSDAAITGAVNFPDLGLYMTGSLYSDKVNWRCY